jgi:Zn-dependent protease with chaperone function
MPTRSSEVKPASFRNYLLVLAGSLLTAPIVTLALSRRATALGEMRWLPTAARAVLAATLLLPAAHLALLLGLRTQAALLARWYPHILRLTLASLASLLIAQGLLLIAAVPLMVAGAPGSAPYPPLALAAIFLIPLLFFFGAGLVVAGGLTAARLPNALAVVPLELPGQIVSATLVPRLAARVERIAQQLGATPPSRMILGLRPMAFVTRGSLRLHGTGLVPPEETLYLPFAALHALSDGELDALIAHELAHFRAADLYLTERFRPALAGLIRSTQDFARTEKGFLALGRLPALLAVGGMLSLFTHVAGPLLRQRELAADRAAADVASGRDVVATLTKLAVMGWCWKRFAQLYGKLAHDGIGRSNLVGDFLWFAQSLLGRLPRENLLQYLLKSRQPHPGDSHPTLAARAAALGVSAEEVAANALTEFMQVRHAALESEASERAMTASEMDVTRRPGRAVEVSDAPLSEIMAARAARAPAAPEPGAVAHG